LGLAARSVPARRTADEHRHQQGLQPPAPSRRADGGRGRGRLPARDPSGGAGSGARPGGARRRVAAMNLTGARSTLRSMGSSTPGRLVLALLGVWIVLGMARPVGLAQDAIPLLVAGELVVEDPGSVYVDGETGGI